MQTNQNQPSNFNLLQSTKFRLEFARLPNMTFFLQTCILPGVSVGEALTPTPFVDIPRPGDKLQFDPLTVTFLLDEELQAWKEIFEWMQGYTFPEKFEQYQNLKNLSPITRLSSQPQYSDAMLTVYSNAHVPVYRLKFVGMFPITLGGVTFSSSDSPENVLLTDASFRYAYFTLESAGNMESIV